MSYFSELHAQQRSPRGLSALAVEDPDFGEYLSYSSLEPVDDDPRCTNCGCYRSEHGMYPCDGFTTKPGGFFVYTQSDLAEMSYDEIEELFGRGRDPEDEDDDVSFYTEDEYYDGDEYERD